MTDASALHLIVQLGSFGLLAWIAVYVVRVIIPRVVAAFEAQATKFEQMHERQELRHTRELEKLDAATEQIADALYRVTERLVKLETRTDLHRPVPHRHSHRTHPFPGNSRTARAPPGHHRNRSVPPPEKTSRNPRNARAASPSLLVRAHRGPRTPARERNGTSCTAPWSNATWN